MDFDEFDFDQPSLPIRNSSQQSHDSLSSRHSRGSSKQTKSVDRSFASSSTRSSQSPSRIRQRRRAEKDNESRQQHAHVDDDDAGEVASTVSSSASSSKESSFATASLAAVSTERIQVSIRGAGSSSYAAQDAGTYQMLHDECSYLCSTILSRRKHPSKAIEAAIDLVTILSSRKTRAILWQHGFDGEETNNTDMAGSDRKLPARVPIDDTAPSTNAIVTQKASSSSKILKSVLEVLAVLTQQHAHISPGRSGHNNQNSSVCSPIRKSNNSAPNTPTKSRTKSARRKEKELLQTGGGATAISGAIVATKMITENVATKSQASVLTLEMKQVLACLVYYLSWDCTMSEEHSVAAMRGFSSPTIARKIRLAILEHPNALCGIMKLMSSTPTQSNRKGSARLNAEKLSASVRKYATPVTSPSQSNKRPTLDLSQTSNSISSVSFVDESIATSGNIDTTTIVKEDPTKLGRRNRKKRKISEMQASETLSTQRDMETIPEQTIDIEENSNKSDRHGSNTTDSNTTDFFFDRKMMPPPNKRGISKVKNQVTGKTKSARQKLQNDELSFKTGSSNTDAVQSLLTDPRRARSGSSVLSWDDDFSMTSNATDISLRLSARAMEKLASLRTKVQLDAIVNNTSSRPASRDENRNFQEAFYAEDNSQIYNGIIPENDSPWVSMVCLEALNRIVTGREEGGRSCMEEEESSGAAASGARDDDDLTDEENNPIFVTNRLLGKSGILPLLGSAMAITMVTATNLLFDKDDENDLIEESDDGEECWKYILYRLSLLSSLIDGACLLSESNRRALSEDDPFSFEEEKDGLIFHLLLFLQRCYQFDLTQPNEKRSEVMLLALRTLTSLSHDNPVAVEQMTLLNDRSNRGVEVLANLVYKLEESTPNSRTSNSKRPTTKKSTMRANDHHDTHHYDCTIFCFNSLANIIEGAGVRRILTEMMVQDPLRTKKNILWLKWLCRWYVRQTESFRDEIMSIGQKTEKSSTNTQQQEPREELQKHEEEKLVAAGNCCVVLACLMTEPEHDDPESSTTIRQLIIDEMPLSQDEEGESLGVGMIINTLKAFCNYYHLSLGQLSLAVVAPVKKLIEELEDIERFEQSRE